MFNGFRQIAQSIGILRRDDAHAQQSRPKQQRRARIFETVEPRVMLNGIGVFDPLEVGAVYIEGDFGSDAGADTLEITFNGGGPDSTLDRVIISGDKAFNYEQFLATGQAGALKNLDVFYDTINSGDPGDIFGKDLGSPFRMVSAAGIDSFNVSVVDGSSLLVLDFTGFDAGEKFVFQIDVDQVLDLNEVPISEGLDAITSGVEFQNSTLAVEFSSPTFADASGTGKFKDNYDSFLVDRTLNLTPDDGLNPDPNLTIRNRTAGVAFDVNQDPLPISIAGTVFHDRDLDLVQDANVDPKLNEHGIDGVELQLWKLNNDTGVYEDTGHATTTAGGGHYEFGTTLNLKPGVYEVREGAADGYFDVGAIPGEVNGDDVGERGNTNDPTTFTSNAEWNRFHNVLTRIEIPLGGQHGVNYDFAEAKLAEVSGFVYHDRDNDGLKEAGEEGLGGIEMLIQPIDWPLPGTGPTPTVVDYGPGNGRVTATVTTNPDGSYKFDNMRPGRYRIIQLEQPTDFIDGKETAGTVDGSAVGTPINPLNPGRIDDIVLVSDSIGINYNFGEYKTVSISGNVHLSDPDGNCFGDDPTAVHKPVEGAKVELWNAAGTTLLDTALTDKDGNYSFDDLLQGTYRVREFTPTDLLDGGEHVGNVAGVGDVGAVTGSDATLGYDEIAGITLLAGQDGVHYDFCEHVPAEISGYVYHDRDDDGNRDPNPGDPAHEEGIGGVTMSLVDVATGLVVKTTTTNGNGFYRFTDLRAGMYRVEEGNPGAQWTDGKDKAGTIRRDGTLVDPTNFGNAQEPDAIRQIKIGYGDVGVNYNFGEILPTSIHGNVHLSDPDGDCFGDDPAVHKPVVGATVELWNAAGTVRLDSTTTDINGDYSFTNLRPGEYTVREFTPAGLLDGGEHVGSVGGVDDVGAVTGNDLTDGYDEISGITLLSGQSGVHYDFCEHPPAQISGYVYHDRDDDGNRDPNPGDPSNEEGIGGVTMSLIDVTTNTVVATTTTNGNGFYRFDNLHAGMYRIEEGFPGAEWTDGKDRAGTILRDGVLVAATNFGNAQEPDTIRQIKIGYGDVGTEYNFGEIKDTSIQGRVHLSTPDGDCFGDDPATYRPVVGAKVELWNAAGTQLLETTFTDDNGDYSFENLRPGTYTVREYTPGDLLDGDEHVGEIDGVADVVAGISGTDDVIGYDEISGIALTSGQKAVHYDFCEHEPAKISGFVYHDRDNDGIKEAGEEGIARVTMALIDLDTNTVIQTTTTDSTGMYMFGDLLAGRYKVQEGFPGPQWTDGIDTAGTIVRDGTRLTRATSGDVGDEMESDMIVDINLKNGDRGEDYNFGEYLPGTIAGRVHLADPNGDCEIPAGQTPSRPLEGVIIKLYEGAILPANLIGTTTTDQFGYYEFTGLDAGNYTIVEETPAGLLDGAEHVGSHGGIVLNADNRQSVIGDINLTSGDNGIEYDFCEHEPAKIAGFVYHDRDNDGIKETGEEGIEGVTMTLIDLETSTVVATTTTDSTGMYCFDNLFVGRYKIQEGDPGAQWIDGIDTEGTILRDGTVLSSATSSDVGEDMEPDMIIDIDILGGDHGENYNFGEYLPGSIEGYVFVHPNGECLLQPGEVPSDALQGIQIELVDSSGVVIATTNTLADGSYRFDNLMPGTYTVREGATPGYFDGDESIGFRTLPTGFEDGSGHDLTDDQLRGIALTSGDALIHYNFCEAPVASISGYVFQDGKPIFSVNGTLPDDINTLRDGILTPDDTRIPGVTLELHDTFGGAAVTADQALPGVYASGPLRTTTNAEGYYEFTGLRAGNYTVVEVQPAGYLDHLDTAGTRGGALNGVAINSVSDISPAVFGGWTTAPTLDTIGLIGLPPGDQAINNNFSEVATYKIPIIPPPPPYEPPPVVVVPPPNAPPVLIPPSHVPFVTTAIPTRYAPQIGYTWHLSVIDAGQPRVASEVGNASQFTSGSPIHVTAWEARGVNEGTWRFAGNDNQPLFGLEGATPIVGDFNGDGVDEIGVYLDGEWFIDLNANGQWDADDLWAKLGDREDRPVVGDWDGDGKDDIGIFGPIWDRDPIAIRHDPGLPDPYNPHLGKPKNLPPIVEEATKGVRLLQRSDEGATRQDLIDHVFLYGQADDAPVAGDWNGDGIRTIGVFKDGRWQLDSNGDGRFTASDETAHYGIAGDRPVVGDFNGDGVDELGVYRGGMWIMDTNGNHEIDAQDKVFELGGALDLPVAGDWNGDGVDEPAVYRGGRPARLAALPSE